LTSGHAAPEEAAAAGTSKPDKPAYDKEQERLKVEIDAVTKKLVRNPTPSFARFLPLFFYPCHVLLKSMLMERSIGWILND
jgi:hypothetical protein